MWPLEDLRENWKVVLAIGVLLVVHVLTFSAQEMSLQRERELSAGLLGNAQESANREARMLATIASQATRVSELESALRAMGQLPDATPTPERASSASTPTTAAVVVLPETPRLPSVTPLPPTSTATARPTSPSPPPLPTATASAAASPPPAATATGSAASAVRFVSTPDGRGVRVRQECASNSPAAGVWEDGTRVTVVEASPSCPGWLKVQDASGTSGWVADFLLSPNPPG